MTTSEAIAAVRAEIDALEACLATAASERRAAIFGSSEGAHALAGALQRARNQSERVTDMARVLELATHEVKP